jgi:hypothetical protein
MSKSKVLLLPSDLSAADLGRLMMHATGLFKTSEQDEFSRVLLGTYCITLVRLAQGDLVTTAVMMEYDPSHLNTVSRRASKLVSLGLLERNKVINDNKRYEVAFNVPEKLVEMLRRRPGK